MEANKPDVIQLIQNRRYALSDVDAVAMHPDTVDEIRDFAERYLDLVSKDPFKKAHLEGVSSDPDEGVKVFGWTVLQSREIPRGKIRYVQYLDSAGA
jgi:hypothetical protein